MTRLRRAFTFEISIRMLADVIILNASLFCGFVALALATGRPISVYFRGYLQTNWVLTLIGLVVFYAMGFYTKGRAYRSRYKALVLFESSALVFLIFGFGLYFTYHTVLVPRFALLGAWLMATFLMIVARLWASVWATVVMLEHRTIGVPLPEDRQKRVLVIGGGGYIGSSLIPKLLASGFQVRLLDCFVFGEEPISAFRDHPELEIHRADFRQIDAVVRAMKGMGSVVHLGGIVGDPACALDEDLTVEINLSATRMIAEVAKGEGISRFVFASSCSVYGASDEMLDERSSLNPISLYAKSKIACERVLLPMRSSSFLPVLLRFGTIYGLSGRTRFDLVLNILTARAAVDGLIPVLGPDQWRPFVHVEDAALAIVKVLEARPERLGEVIFNVGSDEQNFTLGEVGALVEKFVPEAKLILTRENVDRRNYRVSFRRIRERLDFQPQWTVEQGIQQVLNAITTGRVTDHRDPRYSNVQFLSRSKLPKNSGWEKQLLQVPADHLAA